MLPNVEFETWKNKRRKTLIGYIIVGCLSGIDYTIVFATLYLYLEDLVKTKQSSLYYGLTICLYILSSILSSLIVSRITDNRRSIREFTFVSLALQAVGNAIYVIHFSPLFLVFGRLIAGTGDFFRGLACGEIARIFDEREIIKSLWRFTAAYSLGAAIGPAFGGAFQGIEFSIGPITVTYLNFPGILLFFLNLLVILVSYFLIYDCSKEFDLKAYASEEKKTLKNGEESTKNYESAKDIEKGRLLEGLPVSCKDQPAMLRILATFIVDKNIFLIMISTLVFAYSLYCIDIMSPIVVLKTLKWNISYYAILWSSNAVAYFLIMLAGAKFCTNTIRVYWTVIICGLANVICLVCYILIYILPRDFVTDIILMVIFQIPYSFTWLLEEVLLTSLLANMVQSNVQCFAESFRGGISKFSSLLAALTVPLIIPYLVTWFSLLCILVFFSLVTFIWRKSSLIETQPIEI